MLCCGLYPCNLSPNVWEAKTALNKAAKRDCHTELLGTASALLVSLFPLGLGTDVPVFPSPSLH